MEHGEGIKIRVIAKRPDSKFYVTNVSNRLQNLQKYERKNVE